MAGKLCDGVATNVPYLRDSKAYCEGRAAAAAAAPKGTNPHLSGGEDARAWDDGHDSWAADPAGGPGQDCCADAYGGGYTPP